jgi:NAD(P)-dependent dehydrogenase (short-subunit alcohol dehydrogenase family)
VPAEISQERIMRLAGKVAIVTGGGKGIGKAIALAFGREGATVVIASRTVSALEETCSEIGGRGGQATYVQTDVSDEKQVQRLVAETIRQFGQVDVLVNNSGVAGPTCKVVDMDLSQWNETLAVDLTGSMVCAREVLKHMMPRGTGSIVNVVSEGGRSGDGRSGYPLRAAYCCSKMGLIGLTETLSVEMGEYGIRVNALSPGPVLGERIVSVIRKRVSETGKTFEEMMTTLAANNSLKRIATEEECAAVAVFLASEESSAVTGQTIAVSCGQHVNF